MTSLINYPAPLYPRTWRLIGICNTLYPPRKVIEIEQGLKRFSGSMSVDRFAL